MYNFTDLYPSACEDWIDPLSILGIIVVVHGEIGELTRGFRTHTELLEENVFFYNAQYIPRRGGQQYGQLIPIPLPPFDSPEWPLPDMTTSEAFRSKLRHDFWIAMRPNTGSKQTHLSWFMPIGVFVDLFSAAEDNMHRTPTMFFFRNLSDNLCSSLMDDGWDEKITYGADVIKTVVHRPSVTFKYHIGRSTLYVNFKYNRSRLVSKDVYEPIDQYEHETMVTVHCQMDDCKAQVEVGLTWSLYDVRQEFSIQVGPLSTDLYQMYIFGDGPPLKINSRNEKNYTVDSVLSPKLVRFIARF